MAIETLLTSAVVAAVVTAITGTLIFFFLKRWEDKKRRTFDIRYNEYKHYLKALEHISSTIPEDFERFMNEPYAQCLNEFIAIQRTLLDDSVSMVGRLNQIDIHNPESLRSGEITVKGRHSGQLFENVAIPSSNYRYETYIDHHTHHIHHPR